MAESNASPSVQPYKEFLMEIARTLGVIYARENMDKKAKLLQECLALITGDENTTQATYSLVDTSLVKDMEDLLCKENVPFMSMPGQNGQQLFIVPATYSEALYNIRQEAVKKNAEEYAKINAKDIAQSSKSCGFSEVLQVEVSSTAAYDAAMQELGKSNIQAGVYSKDGRTSILVQSQNMFKTDGKDFQNFKLKMALKESLGDEMFNRADGSNKFLTTEIEGIKWDKEKVVSFVNAIEKNQPKVLCDPTGKSNFAIKVDGKNQITLMQKEEGEWKDMETLPLDFSHGKEPMVNFIQDHAKNIENLQVVEKVEFMNEIVNSEKPSKEFLEKYPKKTQGLKGDIKAINAKKELDVLMDRINMDATNYVKANIDNLGDITNVTVLEQAAEMKADKIRELLVDNNYAPVKEFLAKGENLTPEQETTTMSKSDRMKWKDKIIEAYDGGKGNPLFDFDVTTRKIDKDLFETLVKQQEKQNDMSNNKDLGGDERIMGNNEL